jgi:F0F1-type ATP synthase assembly protein I
MRASADIMVDKFIDNPQRLEELKQDPVATLKAAATEAKAEKIPDTWVYRAIVCFIGGVAVLMVIGLILFYLLDKAPNLEAYFGALGLLVGALAGALVPTGKGGEDK